MNTDADGREVARDFTPIACPVCASRAFDPVAAGQAFPARDGDPTYLMVRCADCRLVYLNPRPSPEADERTVRPGPPGAAAALESLGLDADPAGLVRDAARDLSAGEDLLILTPNVDSWSGRLFGGRHWNAYDFPHRFQVFGRESVTRLAGSAGYQVIGVRTHADWRSWTESLRNFLLDWGASAFWVRAAERSWIARAAANLVEGAGRIAGRGSTLEVRLRPLQQGATERPTEEPRQQPEARRPPAIALRAPPPVAILGAGVAGLTAAVELKRRGIPAVVLEASGKIAGLAQSYRDDEGFSHDFGAHFITNRFAAALGIGSQCRTVHRFGEAVRLGSDTYGYPFGLLRTPRFVASAAREKLLPGGASGESAADFYRREFGSALAEEVAIPLIEAWSGAAATDLARTVSPPQLDRGISHVLKLKLASRWSGRAVANGFSRAQPENPHVFHVYPIEGVSVITDRLAREIEGTIELESRVEAIYVDEGRVRGLRVAGEDRDASTVISTAPVHILPKLVKGTNALDPLLKFRYRAFALVNMRFDIRPVLPEVCTWIPERQYSFFRLTEATLAMPWLAPEGKTVVTADIGCNVGDEFWSMGEEALGEHCAEQMDLLFPGVRKHYLGCHVLRTAVAHPVYMQEYEEARLAFARGLPIAGLHSVGRNGEFAHILMEDVFWLTQRRIREMLGGAGNERGVGA